MTNVTNWFEIDLNALRRNARRVQKLIGERCALWAVVKTSAYGHGAVPIARALQQAGIARMIVATIAEGVELREAGITTPIMALCPPISSEEWSAAQHYRLEVVVEGEWGYQQALMQAERTGVPIDAHLEIDTGLSRLGWQPGELPALLQRWQVEHPIRWRSVFTHFACADRDEDATREQLKQFLTAVEGLRQAGFPDVPLHAAASAGLLTLPESSLHAVRCGLLLYGIMPLISSPPELGLEPVLSWRARVLSVRTIPAGQGVSYGWRFRAPRPTRVATLGVGYAGGYPLALSGRSEVILHGQRVPQIGRICMDMMMIDVSELPAVQPGEVATLIGADGNARIRVEELAQLVPTTPHEIVARLGDRPPRLFLNATGEFFERDSV